MSPSPGPSHTMRLLVLLCLGAVVELTLGVLILKSLLQLNPGLPPLLGTVPLLQPPGDNRWRYTRVRRFMAALRTVRCPRWFD